MAISSLMQGDWQAAQLRRLYRAVFHEASNPIGGALGCLQAAQNGLIEADELPQYLDAVHGGLQRVQRLTAALHRFVLPNEDRSRPVDLKSAIDDAHLLIKKDAAEARVLLANEVEPATVHGGHAGCLQVAVLCLHALLDRQAQRSTLRSKVIETDVSTQLVFSGTANNTSSIPEASMQAVDALCAIHGAIAVWDQPGNRIVIDWKPWK